MQNLHNPRWLLIVNTLPIVVLGLIFIGQYNIIETLLEDDTIKLWKAFSFALGILGIFNFVYTLYLIFKKKNVSVWYSLLALLFYIPFIYLYANHLDKIIPFYVPRWITPNNIFLYVGTFLMPTLLYAMFILVSHFTPQHKEQKAWINFLLAIGIPVLGYLFAQLILPLWQRVDSDFYYHVLIVLVIVATLVFLFFLIRGILIIANKKGAIWKKYQLAWKIPIAIIFPVLGLYLNNGQLFHDFSHNGIFGNFYSAWFYGLAIANGVFICLPNLNNKIYRLILFIARSVTFSYTFYFFLVFLPFLPLSFFAIIAIGTGFLMLTPLVLFIVHTKVLSKDFTYLNTLFSKKIILVISFMAFMVIPTGITLTYLKDKMVLNETLAYLYTPDYSKQYNIDKTSLQKTIDIVKGHKKNRSRNIIFSNGIPYLSSYFNWLVLDNLMLTNKKISTIESVFFGEPALKFYPENIRNKYVCITDITTSSTYDSSQKAWKSWVNFELTNNSDDTWFNEYATTIDLPEGCWISDYYLYVGDKKEPGILAEKKSAMWVFSQIRRENRDPGILYYLTGNKVAFRVFPFSKGEVRKTGIEFIHKEPINFSVDNHIVELGNQQETTNRNVETENAIYVSAQKKESLSKVQRKPYFHFLMDVSNNKNQYSKDFTKRIKQILETYKPLSENAQISFVNTYVNTIAIDKDWEEKYRNQTFEGGFYLDRAIKQTLYKAYNDESKSYPVIVVVTDSIDNAILDKDFSDFKFAFPESDLFYNLDKNGFLTTHSLTKTPKQQAPEVKRECMFCDTVLEYRIDRNSMAYLLDNNQPSIILKKNGFELTEKEVKEKNWLSALNMQGQWISQTLHPETSEKEWLNLVKYSFKSKVMTPVTSYIVVENEAQKAILKKKQEQVLSGNKSLDLGEDATRMSEPSLILLMVVFGSVLWYRRKRKTRKSY